MGCKDWFTAKVRTNGDLQAAMDKAQTADTGYDIEIICDKHDYPPSTKLLHSRLKAFYGL